MMPVQHGEWEALLPSPIENGECFFLWCTFESDVIYLININVITMLSLTCGISLVCCSCDHPLELLISLSSTTVYCEVPLTLLVKHNTLVNVRTNFFQAVQSHCLSTVSF